MEFSDSRLSPVRNPELHPDVVDALRKVWKSIGRYLGGSFEQFEHRHTKNLSQVSELGYLAYCAARMENYWAQHPKTTHERCKKHWRQVQEDFDAISPYANIVHEDGTVEKQLAFAAEPPTQELVERTRLVKDWLAENDIHLLDGGNWACPPAANCNPPAPAPGHMAIRDLEIAANREIFKAAEVVLGWDYNTGNTFIMFGREEMENNADSDGNYSGRILYIDLDPSGNQLEFLVAACEVLKGRCDYGNLIE